LQVAVTAPVSLIVVPGQLMDASDAAATAGRVANQQGLLRFGIACESFHRTVEVLLVLALFKLFKPVNPSLTWQLAIPGRMPMPIPIAVLDVLNEVAALMLFGGAVFLSVFDKPQLDAGVLFFMRLHGHGFRLAAVFWGP